MFWHLTLRKRLPRESPPAAAWGAALGFTRVRLCTLEGVSTLPWAFFLVYVSVASHIALCVYRWQMCLYCFIGGIAVELHFARWMWIAGVCFRTLAANKIPFKSCSNVRDTIFHGKVLSVYCSVESKVLEMRKQDILKVKFSVSEKEGNSVLSLITDFFFSVLELEPVQFPQLTVLLCLI